MPVETGQYLSDLNTNFPNPTDGASQGDDHLRLIKSVLKTTFPAVAGAVTGSHTELNEAVATTANGASKLADAGAFFNTNSTDGFTNPAAGEVDLVAGGNVVAKIRSDKSISAQGTVAASLFAGPGTMPIGGTIVWWSDTLPDPAYHGTWAWCNGGTYLRSNTTLWNILGTSFGNGDGTTTANLPDLREATPVGKSTMGATAARGVITNFTSAVLTKIGQLFGEATHKLTVAEAPRGLHTLNFSDPGHSHGLPGVGNATGVVAGSDYQGITNSGTQKSSAAAYTDITASLTDNAGDGVHNNVQPSVVCNWIIRTA